MICEYATFIVVRKYFLTLFFSFYHYSPGDEKDQLILTKGDNNDRDDLGLYDGPLWLRRKNIIGKVRG